MSSYIVEYKTINRIVTKIGLRDDAATEYGRKLLAMNIDATEQRYSEPYLKPEERKDYLSKYNFHIDGVSDIQALKSLRSLHYQCLEGTIPKRKLYKQLDKLSDKWAYEIVDSLPEFDKAEWG